MARTKATPKKSAARAKQSSFRKQFPLTQVLQYARLWLFVIVFGGIGAYFYASTFASPELPTYSDDIVAGYISLTPTLISQDENGNKAYEMYPASTYVQADGTIVCDAGGAVNTVSTGVLSRGEVKKLQKDIYATGLNDLADEIGFGTNDAFVSFEGMMVAGSSDAKGTAVYPGASKPTAFTKAQDTLTRLCAKATRTTERAAVKPPREPNIKKTDKKKTAFSFVSESLFPKASACCSAGVTEDTNFEYQHYTSINDWRKQNGRRALPHDQCSGDKATMHSNYMASTGKFEHSKQIAADADACRKGWRKLGENVGVGYDNSGLMKAFKGSASHNKNMLDTAWTQMGIGAVWVPDGSYKKYYVTQRYAAY